MGIPDYLNCFLKTLYAGQEATIRTRHGTTDWFQIGKGVHKGSILPPCLFNLYAEYITRNAGLEEAQAGIKISGRNSYSFSSSHVWCESWTIKKAESWRIDAFKLWCWRRLLRVPWTERRSNQPNPKGNQSWVFIERTDAEAETPILWPPDGKSWLTGKDSDAGKNWV